MFDGEAFGAEIVDVVKGYVARATAPLLARIDALEKKIAEMPAPKDGVDGVPGRDGVDGKDGAPGADGRSVALEDISPMLTEAVAKAVAEIPPPKDGRDGVDGKDGAPGADGRDGAPGKMPVAKAWVDRVHYESEVVTRDGATWQAIRDTGRGPPSDDWIMLAARGADARGFVVRGTWNEAEVYAKNDIVMLNASSFVALFDAPGPCPGDGWQLWAGAGKAGKPGAKGDRGEKGPAGNDAASVIAFYEKDGVKVLTLSDGQELRA
jgi:hypothetical protein